MHMTGSQVFDLLINLVNFGVMFILFRLVVILPMQDAVKLRGQRVALRLKEIDGIAKEAEETKASFQERFGQVDGVLAEIKETSDRSLSQTQQRLEEKASSEERYILEKAKAEAEAAKRDAEAKVRSKVAGAAVAKAEALLKKSLDDSVQDKVLAFSTKQVGGLNAS